MQPPRSVAERQFLTSTSIDAIGDSPQSAVALCGYYPDAFVLPKTGIVIEASRETGNNFAELAVSVRAWVRFDAAVARASSFVKATGIATTIE